MRAVLSELRSLIHTTIPDSTEKVTLGWRSLNFSHPDVGYFCGVFPLAERVVMAFEFGALLPDPDGILDSRSCAKQVRYLRITSRKSIPRASLKRLLRAAVSLPGDRATRIGLVRSGAKPQVPKPGKRNSRAP
jgi:hypothetical protein